MNLRLVLSGAGLLVAAGAVIGGVALASPSTPAKAPAHVPAVSVTSVAAVTSSTPAPSTSAAPVSTKPAVKRSTHHAVAPKETTVATKPVEQPSSTEAAPIPVIESDGRAGNAPPPVLPPPPPISVPSGYTEPSPSS